MLGNFLKSFASKLLAVDNTSQSKEQVRLLKDVLSKYRFEVDAEDFSSLLSSLKKKHLVDSVIITKRDGTVIASSEQNGLKTAITGTALYNYVNSELAKTETILIKSGNDWFMVFPFNSRVFVVKAAASLSNIELKALAEELDLYLNNFIQTENKAFLKN